nr:MAG TPA: hypothetical protein [Bacteriophage sp.]
MLKEEEMSNLDIMKTFSCTYFFLHIQKIGVNR